MLSPLSNITRTDVYNGATDTLRRGDDDIVVFSDLESVERFTGRWFIENTKINRVWNGIIDEFTQNKTISAFIEQLHSFRRNGKAVANV